MRKQALTVLLILSLPIAISVFGEVQTHDQYSLQHQYVTWDHTKLSVLIVPQDGEVWWNPSYVNSSLRAIGQWNDAIADFAANYSDFEYLSKVRFVPTVSNVTRLKFDVYVSWTEFSLDESEDQVGLAKTVYGRLGTIANCTISLASKNQRGNVLSEVDMQNIALHELGHSLSLRHSNYTGDLMYQSYTRGNPVRAVSTLDVYGVAAIFQWIPNSSQFYPVNKWLRTSSVSLPPTIEYEYLPISDENLPPQSFLDPILIPIQTFLDDFLEFILRPEFSIPMLVIVVVAVAIMLIPNRRKIEHNTF
jgi:predicted Zn-dependent protease